MFAGRTARRGHSQPCGLRYRYHLEFKGGDTPELLELKSSTARPFAAISGVATRALQNKVGIARSP